jgi:hypothetical protein
LTYHDLVKRSSFHVAEAREIRHASQFQDLEESARAGQGGRGKLQNLLDEALTDLIEKRKNAKPRSHVMGAYLASHEKYGPLYRKLAR